MSQFKSSLINLPAGVRHLRQDMWYIIVFYQEFYGKIDMRACRAQKALISTESFLVSKTKKLSSAVGLITAYVPY